MGIYVFRQSSGAWRVRVDGLVQNLHSWFIDRGAEIHGKDVKHVFDLLDAVSCQQWVACSDREPTEADGDENGKLLVANEFGEVRIVSYKDSLRSECSWCRIPRFLTTQWKAATQADLTGITQPIPCRVRQGEEMGWISGLLLIGMVEFCENRFVAVQPGWEPTFWRYCEVRTKA